MRMLLTMLLLVFASIVSFAVEFNQVAWATARATKDDAVKLAFWETVTSPVSKMSSKLLNVAVYTARINKLDADAVIALVDAKAIEYGVTNADDILRTKLKTLINGVRNYTKALELAKTGTGLLVKDYIGFCYGATGDYAKAVELGNASCKIQFVEKLSDATVKYNTCVNLFLGNKLSVANVNKIKGAFLGLRTRGTDITNAQKLADYQDIQDAYSAMVMKDGKRVYVYDTFLAELTAAITRLKARM